MTDKDRPKICACIAFVASFFRSSVSFSTHSTPTALAGTGVTAHGTCLLPAMAAQPPLPVPSPLLRAQMQTTPEWAALQTYMMAARRVGHWRLILMPHTTAPPGGPVHTMGPMHSLKEDGRLDAVASVYQIIAMICSSSCSSSKTSSSYSSNQ